jgi:hypothetical protein
MEVVTPYAIKNLTEEGLVVVRWNLNSALQEQQQTVKRQVSNAA